MEKQMLHYKMSKKIEETLKLKVIEAEKEFWTDANKRWLKEFEESRHYSPTEKAKEIMTYWEDIKKSFCDIGQALLDRRLKLWCEGSSGMMWKAGYIPKGETDIVHIAGYKARTLSSYWSYGRECFHVCCYGTSRPLEIILGIGYSLGIPFHSIHQNQQIL